jgi:hypothetical protein
MKLGIMQPYIFPYIGYFQLINAVDKFVVYDDVNFIKQGWVNRNRILNNGQPIFFTVPLTDASSFKTINQTFISRNIYESFRSKFLKSLAAQYKKAPYFEMVAPMVERVLSSQYDTIGQLALASIKETCEYIGVTTTFVDTSTTYNNADLHAQDRVIDICRKENATTYINVTGGRSLYDKNAFAAQGIELYFISSAPISYPQFKHEFVPWLSIIDVMMFNPKEQVRQMLNQYELT